MVKGFSKRVLFVALLLISFAVSAADSTAVRTTRPKVGLVLSGGGAKGAAHIGVLKYLEEIGMPIDYIAGTSMGAIVGGMYALGYSPDDIFALISSVDWGELMSNNVDRKKISFSSKQDKGSHILSLPFSVNSKREELHSRSVRNSLPDGIISGNNIINFFNSLSVGYSDSLSFSELPTPFICIATNVLSGKAEVLDRGEFTKALRASMAIPIVFDPVKIGKTLYTDGGLVVNFPAEQCRAMGADYIIGVSVSSGLEEDPNKLKSILSQVKQFKEIIVERDFENYHKMCDIFINPDVKGVTSLSFNAESVAKVIQSGYEAASVQDVNFKKLRDAVSAGGVELSASATPRRKKAVNILNNKVLISNVEFVGVDKKVEKWMRRSGSKLIGKKIGKNDIDELVSIYYGTGAYDSITYTLHEDSTAPDGYIVRFKFVDKPAHNFGLGFRFDTQDWLSVLLHIGVNHNRISGFKSDLDAKLGSNQWLKLNLSYGHLLYPRLNLGYTFRNSELDVYDMDELEMNTKFLQNKVRLYLSENYSRTISIGGGIEAEFQFPRKVMYSLYDVSSMDSKPVNTLGAFAYFKFDNLNKHRFPTRGVKGSVNFTWKDAIFDKSGIRALQLGSLLFGFEGYIPIVKDRLVVVPQLYGSFLFGKGATNGQTEGWNPMFKGPVPCYPHMNNIVGGAEMGRYIDQQLPFVGLNKISFAFNNLAIARADIRVRVYKSHYLTAMFNYGRSSVDMKNFFKQSDELLWGSLYDYNASNWWGAGIRYSLDTKVGPLNFDISSSNISKSVNLYFSFGYYF